VKFRDINTLLSAKERLARQKSTMEQQ
jgi:hypothetical protein